MKFSQTMKTDLLWALWGGILTLFLAYPIVQCASGCKPTTQPEPAPVMVEAGTQVATGLCTLLEGLTQNQTVISICATVEEIAIIASVIARMRTIDGGHPHLSDVNMTCFPLAGQEKLFCATPLEIGTGAQEVVRRRGARLMREAGAP